jgi:hypothetical protein
VFGLDPADYGRRVRVFRLVLAVLLLAGCAHPAVATDQPRAAVRVLRLAQGHDRPLPTTVWYPRRPAGIRWCCSATA